ncbi:DNA translocase FtsK 4TM domain-containing protein [Pseudoroseomonas wenyumeiae]
MTNLAGPAGAIVADLLLQGFGWAAMLPSAVALGWAWRLATHKGLAPFAGRAAAVLGALPLLAGALHLLPMGSGGPTLAGPGGAIGELLANSVMSTAQGLLGPLGKLGGEVVVVALAGSLSFAAIGVPLLAWMQMGRSAGRAARGGAELTSGLLRRTTAATPPQPHWAAPARMSRRPSAAPASAAAWPRPSPRWAVPWAGSSPAGGKRPRRSFRPCCARRMPPPPPPRSRPSAARPPFRAAPASPRAVLS